MKKLFALWMAVIMIVTMSSCSPQKPSEPEDTEKLKNGELIIADNETNISVPAYHLDTFNPIITTSSIIADDMKLVYDPLFELDTTLHAVPILAESYTVSENGLNIVIRLKNNVTWHDGDAFTANDVHYTVKYIMQHKSLYSKHLKDVSAYSIVDSYTYAFTLKRPVPGFECLLDFPIVKNNTSMTPDSNDIPIGTGAYKYKEKSSASRVVFTANENWHMGQAKIGNITVDILKDKESAVYAFEANELQCITTRTVDLSRYTPKGKTKTADYVSNNLVFLGYNFYNSVLWGESTRQAISFLIDKEEIVNSDVYGRGTVIDVPINPSAWFYNRDSKKYSKDMEAAEALLSNDGWIKKGDYYTRDFNGKNQVFELKILTVSDNKEKISIANRIASYLQDGGMDVTVKAVPYTEYTALINSKQFDLFLGEIELADNNDPSFLVGSSSNYFTYINSEMDSVINQLGRTRDTETYKQLYTKLGDIFNVDMPFVPLFFRNEKMIYSEDIAGDIKPVFSNVYRSIKDWYFYKQG